MLSKHLNVHKNLLPVTFSLGYTAPCVRLSEFKSQESKKTILNTTQGPAADQGQVGADGGASGTLSVVRALHTKQNGRDQGTPWASQDTTEMPPRAGGRVTQ